MLETQYPVAVKRRCGKTMMIRENDISRQEADERSLEETNIAIGCLVDIPTNNICEYFRSE